MAELETATPTVESPAPESAPQVTEASPQEAPQPQETVQTQVESPQPTPASSQTGRPRPSEFYKSRKEIQSLREQLDTLTNLVKQSQVKSPAETQPRVQTREEIEKAFYADPIGWHEKQMALQREQHQLEIQKLREEVPNILESRSSQSQLVGKQREALEMLFPKTETNPYDDPGERASSDPSRLERIDKIMRNYGLDVLFRTNPNEAAKLTMKLYDDEMKAPPRNPAAPQNKGRMQSVATGSSPAQGGKKMTLEEIKKAKNELLDEANDNPSVRQDEKWIAKRKALVAALDQLDKSGGQ